MKRKFAFVHLFALLALLCTTSCDDSASAPSIFVEQVGLGSDIESGPGSSVTFTCYLADEESLKEITVYCDAWEWYDYWDITYRKETNPSAYYTCSFTVPASESVNFETQQLTFDLENLDGLHTVKVVNICSDKTAPTTNATSTYSTSDASYEMSITLYDNVNLGSYTLSIPTLGYTKTEAVSGVLKVVTPTVDFVTTGSYAGTLTVTDAAGNKVEQSLTITYK